MISGFWTRSLATFVTACIIGIGARDAAQAQTCSEYPDALCITGWSGGAVNGLESLPASNSSIANGVSNSGQIVGVSYFSNGYSKATEWSGGSVIDLGGLSGSNLSSASAINASGQVVGQSDGNATEWSGGNTINLGALPGSTAGSDALAINEVGQVVGTSNFFVAVAGPGGVEVTYATEWSGASIIDLGGLPGSIGSAAYGINDSGQIVGVSYFGLFDSVAVATEWSDGNVIDLGGEDSYAYGINNSGQAVGWSAVAGGGAMEWSDGNSIELGDGQAYAINDAGQVVGVSNGSAIEWSGGTSTDLGGLPGSLNSFAYGINGHGEIVGYSILRTPEGVPEPSTWVTILLGFTGLCYAGYCRSRSGPLASHTPKLKQFTHSHKCAA